VVFVILIFIVDIFLLFSFFVCILLMDLFAVNDVVGNMVFLFI
jgi:hypothetical protein